MHIYFHLFSTDDEDDLTEFARKATKKFIKYGEMFRDVPIELYTFNHREILKRKRDVVQTKKIKESMQQENELAPKKKKKEEKNKKSNSAKSDKNGNNKKQKQKQNKKGKPCKSKDIQKKATTATNQKISEQMIEMTDLVTQFDVASDFLNSGIHSPSEELQSQSTDIQNTGITTEPFTSISQQTGTSLTATWSLCTFDSGDINSPGKTAPRIFPSKQCATVFVGVCKSFS